MKHLYGLDLLRFFAALLVVFYHLSGFSLEAPGFKIGSPEAAFPWVAPIGQHGWIGVQIFFVISGFVIAASAAQASWRQFLIRRAIRIFPALWTCALIALALRLAWGEPLGDRLADAVRSMLLSPKGPYIDGVVWTLVVEAVFYVLIALLIALSPRLPKGLSMLELGAYFLAAISGAFLLVTVLTDLVAPGGGLAQLFDRYFFSVLLLRHGVFFAAGMLVWVGETHGYSRRIGSVLGFALLMCLVQIVDRGGLGATLPLLIFMGALGAAYLSLHHWQTAPNARVASALRDVGRLTYPLYLGHFTVGAYMLPALATFTENTAVLFIALLAIFLILALTVLRGPERALQSWAKSALLRGRPRQTA